MTERERELYRSINRLWARLRHLEWHYMFPPTTHDRHDPGLLTEIIHLKSQLQSEIAELNRVWKWNRPPNSA